MNGKAISSARWFEDHKNCEIEERSVQGLPPGTDLKNYVCMKHGRGLITTEKPGCQPMSGEVLGSVF